jgi:hypothetical protein
MKATSITVGVPVSDLGAARRWYERILGVGPGFESVDGIHEYEVSPGCWLQLFEGEPSSSAQTFRIGVENIESERGLLLRLGVPVGEPSASRASSPSATSSIPTATG